MLPIQPKRKKEAQLLIAIAVLYFVMWLIVPKPAFWGLDNGFKFQGARAFAETGQLGNTYDGAEFDPKGGFRPIVFPFGIMNGDKQVPVFPVIFMILCGIFYALFGAVGPHLLPLLGGYFCLAASWFMWVRFRPGTDGRLFLLMLAMGSPLLFYSMTLWEHSISMAFVILSFTFLIVNPEGANYERFSKTWEIAIAGLLLGLATAFRTEAVFWVIIQIVFWKYTGRNINEIKYYFFGLVIGLGTFLFINYLMTGSFIPLHVTSNFNNHYGSSYLSAFISRASNLYIITFQGFKTKYISIALSIPLLIIALTLNWRKVKKMNYYLAAGVFITWIIYFSLMITAGDRASYTINSGGLFWVVPFAALSVLPFKSKKQPVSWRIFWAGPLLYFLIMALITPTLRGVHWGPRFVLQALPFIVIFGAVRTNRWWKRYPTTRLVIVLLIAISIVNQLYSYNILFEQRKTNAALNEWAAAAGSDPALASMWWLPGDVSLASDRVPWYITGHSSRIPIIVNEFRKKGIPRFTYYEHPPYLTEEFWWSVGAEMKEKDYFLKGDGRLRRCTFRIIR